MNQSYSKFRLTIANFDVLHIIMDIPAFFSRFRSLVNITFLVILKANIRRYPS